MIHCGMVCLCLLSAFSGEVAFFTTVVAGPFFLWGFPSDVVAFVLVHHPRLRALERADVSIGTGMLFQFLGALEELY